MDEECPVHGVVGNRRLRRALSRRVRVRFLVAWYDLWIGAYWDRKGRTLYVCLLPCLGFRVEFLRREI